MNVEEKYLRWPILLVIGVLLALALCGCGASEGVAEPVEGDRSSGTLEEDAAGELMPFLVQVEQAGDPIGLDLRGVLQAGSLRLVVLSEGGAVAWEETVSTPGLLSVNTVVDAPAAGEYQLGLAWEGPVVASYSLTWGAGAVDVGQVQLVALLGGLGMIAVAVGFVIYAVVRKLGWGYLGLGALAWVLTVALKIIWALVANSPIYSIFQEVLPETLADPLFSLYVGALTGVFEVLLVWLVMRYTELGQMSWKHALAFGIGFGAVESLALGAQSLATTVAALAAPAVVPLPPETIAQLNNPLYGLTAITEGFFAVLLHTFSNLLIIYGARTRQARWFWLAFAYKTGIDTIAAFAQVQGLVTFPGLWAIEAFVVLWGVVGWLGIRWLRPRWPADGEDTPDGPGEAAPLPSAG